MLRRLLALLLCLAPADALAQAMQCSVPSVLPRPQIVAPTAKEPRRMLPIGGYTLALSWSPQHCSTVYSAFDPKDDFQCKGRNGRFGFILHGLWPDGVGADWPQYCRPAALVPREVIAQTLCVTPSVQLIQHEWAKHGTCTATRPELYFTLARTFYQTIRYPDMAKLARQPDLTVGAFIQAFVGMNKGLRADMIGVRTTRGAWLDELWLCMDRRMDYARCPTNKPGVDVMSVLRIEPGPAFAPPRAAPSPALSEKRKATPKPDAKAQAQPRRRPGLILDLDPKVQPLTNSSAK
jgi:ribonuclease T2